MRNRGRFLLVFFMLLFGQAVAGQVSFEAKVSKNRLGLNERLRVSFSMNQDGDNFNPPAFEGFHRGGRSQPIGE